MIDKSGARSDRCDVCWRVRGNPPSRSNMKPPDECWREARPLSAIFEGDCYRVGYENLLESVRNQPAQRSGT